MTKARKTPPASTFHQQLVDYENRRHTARLAEIKKASARLAQFEPVAQALEAKRISLSLSWHLGGRSLRVTRGSSTMYDHALYDALLEFGFTETERTGTRYQTVVLKKGRLCLELSVEGGYREPVPAQPAKDVQTWLGEKLFTVAPDSLQETLPPAPWPCPAASALPSHPAAHRPGPTASLQEEPHQSTVAPREQASGSSAPDDLPLSARLPGGSDSSSTCVFPFEKG